MNGRAVLESYFDGLDAVILSFKTSQHLVCMTKRLGALKWRNIESKDIVLNKIKAAYESAALQIDQRRNKKQTIPF